MFTFCVACGSLPAARRAQAMLGAETWSEVVKIENTLPGAVYSKTVYALIFELEGILWFYTAAEGTQSLSLYRHRTAQDKGELAMLLREIDRGFARYETISRNEEAAGFPGGGAPEVLPNGCFIESVVLARSLAVRRGITDARLLMYYSPSRVSGHCVLAFQSAEGIFVVDPTGGPKPVRAARKWPSDLAELVRSTTGLKSLAAVRSLPLQPAVRSSVFAAATESQTGDTKG